jgi:hypothetical protein
MEIQSYRNHTEAKQILSNLLKHTEEMVKRLHFQFTLQEFYPSN